jgi:hypothetical protein
VPLTEFQRAVLALLAPMRTPDSYLAGGAALHFQPNSTRFSNDLDFFHDSEERVAAAFSSDRALLERAGYQVVVELSQPGHVRAVVTGEDGETGIDWAHDSAWRFMPPVKDALGGFLLHPIDLAVNKALALAGRDEPRDYVDILFVHERILRLGALCWGAAGKDPGFTPLSLLELLKRRGRHRQADLDRLNLGAPFDVKEAKQTWLSALEAAESFVRSRPAEELGCLYYFPGTGSFGEPLAGTDLDAQGVVPHWGTPGGVLPQPTGRSLQPESKGPAAR